MTHIYNRGLRVSPFIIAPIGLINREAAIVLGPRSLANRSDDLIRLLYSHIAEQDLNCRVIAQFIPYQGGVLITTTIQTKVPDANSGRLGLKLTYGAWISRDIFLYHSNVCTRVFELLNLYFQKVFGAPASIEIAEKIVSSLQRPNQSSDELLGQDDTDELLNRFESELCISDKLPLTAFRRAYLWFRWHRLLRWPKRRPLICMGDTIGFWSDIDTSLKLSNTVVAQPRGIHSDLDTIALTVPRTTLAVLKKIAISRDLSDQDLLISYIEQESRRDLAILVGDPGLGATAKVLAQHIQSEDEVQAIVCEIRGEAIAQAKMDEPS